MPIKREAKNEKMHDLLDFEVATRGKNEPGRKNKLLKLSLVIEPINMLFSEGTTIL